MNKELNVFSKSKDPLGRALSNFAHTPFELDGVQYASVEAFYQSLKCEDPHKRAQIALLWGSYAKAATKKIAAVQQTKYMGTTYVIGSDEHLALIERAIRAKIEQNPIIMRVLAKSKPRPIVHDTGKDQQFRKSALPGEIFASMISRIRETLIGEQQLMPIEFDLWQLGEIDAHGGKSEQIEASTIDTVTGGILDCAPPPLMTVTECLAQITDERLEHWHDLAGWAKAYEGYDQMVSAIVGGGSDSIALRLESGDVLKMHSRPLEQAAGSRPFDLPILDRGYRLNKGINICYYVQPYAMRPLAADLQTVGRSIADCGYQFSEPFFQQIGRWKGRPFLLDPWAVKLKVDHSK